MDLSAWIKGLDIPARLGWIALIAGGVALGLIRYNIWPFDEPGGVSPALAGGGIIIGLAVVVVDIVQRLLRKSSETIARHRAASSLQAEEKATEARAVDNLRLLDNIEVRRLLWVFRSGSPRFYASEVGGLLTKDIIKGDGGVYSNIWVVRDSVWAQRENAMKAWSHFQTESAYPYSHF